MSLSFHAGQISVPSWEDGAETFDEVDNNGGMYDYIYAVHRVATNFGE